MYTISVNFVKYTAKLGSVLSLALVLFLSALEVPVSTHFCQGEAVSAKLYATAPSCHSTPEAMEHASATEFQSTPCCANSQELIRANIPAQNPPSGAQTFISQYVSALYAWVAWATPWELPRWESWPVRSPPPLSPPHRAGLVIYFQNILI